ncbi:MAG: hypothetical protein ABL309_13880 [Phycisphaerales bacterium]
MKRNTTLIGFLTLLAACAVVAVGTLTAGGCQSLQGMFSGTEEEARAHWQAEIDRIEGKVAQITQQVEIGQTALEQYREQLEGLDENDPIAQWIRTQIAVIQDRTQQALDVKSQYEAEWNQAKTRLANIQAGGSGLSYGLQATGEVVGSAGAVLPPPWNGIAWGVSGLLGVIGTTIGVSKTKKAKEADETTEQVVMGIEAAKRRNEHLANAFHEAGGDIRLALTPKVARKVDAIRRGA